MFVTKSPGFYPESRVFLTFETAVVTQTIQLLNN